MKFYNKLVRDKIPEICRSNGDIPNTRIIEDDSEYLVALCNKLDEETQEVKEDPCIEELVDALEVVLSIGRVLGYSPRQIEAARIQKAQERGGFEQRIYLISTE